MPETLRKINWIDFKETDFSIAFADLLQAVELDREHAAIHTSTQQRANEWKDQSKIIDYLLNATACVNIEKWLSEAYETDIKKIYENAKKLESKKSPQPTALQIDFTKASREEIKAIAKKEKKRQRQVITIVTITAIIAIIFGVFGSFMWQKAEVERKKTNNLTISRAFQNAEKYQKDERFQKAIDEYLYLQTKFNIDSVQKNIDECNKFDSISNFFYKKINIADSLIKTENTENYIKADSIYKILQTLDYEPGNAKLLTKINTKEMIINNFVEENIKIAKKYIEAGYVMYPEAKIILKQTLKLQPDNQEITKLLKRIN